MTIKLSRTNGAYNATVSNKATGFERRGEFHTPAEAVGAIRAWKTMATGL